MDVFFEKYSVILGDFKHLFVTANIRNNDFYNLSIEKILKIFKDDPNSFALFLSVYNQEKVNYTQQNSIVNAVLINSNESMIVESCLVEDVQSQHNYAFNSTNVVTVDEQMEIVCEENNECDANIIISESMTGDKESSLHDNLQDDFQYVENKLYFLLMDDLEGKIILGMYKNEKILLERRLKVFIIQKIIVEDPITYKITAKTFLELKEELKQLFPTIRKIGDWYTPNHRNDVGAWMSASGCLVNYYKTCRTELVRSRVWKRQTNPIPTSGNNTGTVAQANESDLLPLTESDRSKYLVDTVFQVWKSPYEERQRMLVSEKNKKVTIHYETYLNTFKCLHTSLGLDLLQSDCARLIENLAKDSKISQDIAQQFQTKFSDTWLPKAQKICKLAASSHIRDINDFKRIYKECLDSASTSILALFYLPFFLTKAVTIKTKTKGSITFLRSDISDHFIKLIENESELDTYKKTFEKKLTDYGFQVHPYIVFCGKLNDISEAIIVVNGENYEFKNPLKAIDICYKISVALHCCSDICINIWNYIQVHVYEIRLDIHYAFPPGKSLKTISSFIEKIDKLIL